MTKSFPTMTIHLSRLGPRENFGQQENVTSSVGHVTTVANVTTTEANLTIHDHAAAAQASALEALHHLEQAQKSYNMTKTNVKEILKTDN